MLPPSRALHASPHWNVTLESGDRLVLLAGADEMFLFDEATGEPARALHQAFTTDTLTELSATRPDLDPLLALLERAGAIHRALTVAGPLRWSLIAHGEASEAITTPLRAFAERSPELEYTDESPSFVVLLRTGGELLAAAERASGVTAPHVLIDAAYDHTLSLGPLVWPDETACLQCFAGRIRHAWGDPPAPRTPRATTNPELVAGHIVALLRRFQREGSLPELCGRTVSIDLSALNLRADAVHRLPWCPRCFPKGRAHTTGYYPLRSDDHDSSDPPVR